MNKLHSFDPGLRDAYLVEAARKIGSTLTSEEKIALLRRKYSVTFSLARSAVNYSNQN